MDKMYTFEECAGMMLGFLEHAEKELSYSTSLLKMTNDIQTIGEVDYIIAKIRAARYALVDCKEAFARLPAITEDLRNKDQ